MLLMNALWLVALGFITYARVSGVIVAGLTGAPVYQHRVVWRMHNMHHDAKTD